MAKADDMKAQDVDANEHTQFTQEQRNRAGRRQFLLGALATTSGVALAVSGKRFFPSSLAATQTQPVCPPPSPAFIPVGEITSRDGKLKAVLSVIGGKDRIVPGSTKPLALRFYSGYNPDNPSQRWPVSTNAGPGPTFRCEVGDSVQITFLNRVNLKDFMGSNLYSAEGGTTTGLCDEVNAGRWYPANDKYPNCFHASSAANVHFHGTHVTPSTTGDNVLVNVWPDPTMTDADAKMIQQWFQQIFDKGEAVSDWNGLSEDWRRYQVGLPKPLTPNYPKGLVGRYDDTAVYQGQRGKLPENLRLWPANDKKIKDGIWPQYYVGSYPICFRIPKWNGSSDSMGQAPGTHWYHSHKHGSTSINLFNGLEGALIIEDNSPTGYDGALKAYYSKQGQKLDQFVLVLQQITDTINMMVTNPSGGPPPVLVNGQLTPTITMQPGQIQLWRFINGTVQAFINAQFNSVQQKTLTAGLGSLKVNYRQTAQDGIQLAWENYSKDQNANPPFKLSPANRIDVLVQAPSATGCYVLQDARFGPLLFINVTGTSPPMKFPGTDADGKITIKSDYPPMPAFLADITSAKPHDKPIVYGSRKDTTTLPPNGNPSTLRQFTIDNTQFTDGRIDQRVKLGDAEEWRIENTDTATGISHPFHIHVNPFQVVEVYDPATMAKPLVLQPPYVWWDAFAIPAGGYFKMRSRFVDFTGLYVQHCHILAHEDRGMMQLVQVCKDPNSEECKKQADVKHH